MTLSASFSYSYQSLTNPDEAAADLVDLLLFGSTLHLATIIGANASTMTNVYWWLRRDAFLDALKAESEAKPDLPLNHDSVVEAAQRWLGLTDE